MRETRPTLSLDRTDRAAWQASFDQDVINLRRLPTQRLVCKARAILERIGMGTPYTRSGANASTGIAPSSPCL